jgi:predicted HicB family RNase H-like nuclease
MSHTIVVMVNEETHRRLKERAEDDHLSVAAFVKMSIAKECGVD